jgi:hypothetical protein
MPKVRLFEEPPINGISHAGFTGYELMTYRRMAGKEVWVITIAYWDNKYCKKGIKFKSI